MSRPNAITVSSSKRGVTIKASGGAAQALFDKLAAEVSCQQQQSAKAAPPAPASAGAAPLPQDQGDVARG